MTKYTSLETSKKLYEAFPEWEKPKDDTEMHWIASVGYPAQFVHDNCCWLTYEDEEYICPAYDTDYLLEKLQSKKGLAVTKYVGGGWNAHCERKMHGNAKWVDYYEGEADTPAEALGLLALKLKKEGIL